VIGRALFALQRLAARRGPRGDSRVWTAVWVAVFAGRHLYMRSGRRGEDIVLRQEIKPGESLIVTHTGETYAELRKRSRNV
jgi:hypothetical protein